MRFIDIQRQYRLYKKEIDHAVLEALDQANFILGPQIEELEAILAEYVGVKHCLTVSSGTDSLQIALMALNVGPGDEVITTPFTWISSAEVVSLVGAKPVFADIDLETYNISPEAVRRAITPRTKAIIPVDLFGQMADYEALTEISEEFGIPIIEDGAQSFGAKQFGKRSCSMGLVGSTSFFPAKPLGCYGDGGALFTNDTVLNDKMKAIRVHGALERHHHPYVGMNGRLDTLQAAILLARFPHFEKELEKRALLGANYNQAFEGLSETPQTAQGNTHVYAQYTLRLADRSAFAEKMERQGVPTALYYPKCLHEQPVYLPLGYQIGDFPNAEKASREVISLPLHPWLTSEEENKIIEVAKAVLEEMHDKVTVQV